MIYRAPGGPRIAESVTTMHDDMSDLALALLMTVVVAIGLVIFQFRSVAVAQPARAVEVKVEKSKTDKTTPQIAMNDRLYWIR